MDNEQSIIPQGESWRLAGIKGRREDVISDVNNAAFVPTACKTMLVEALEAFDPRETLIRLDVHVNCVKTPQGHTHIGSWSITGL